MMNPFATALGLRPSPRDLQIPPGPPPRQVIPPMPGMEEDQGLQEGVTDPLFMAGAGMDFMTGGSSALARGLGMSLAPELANFATDNPALLFAADMMPMALGLPKNASILWARKPKLPDPPSDFNWLPDETAIERAQRFRDWQKQSTKRAFSTEKPVTYHNIFERADDIPTIDDLRFDRKIGQAALISADGKVGIGAGDEAWHRYVFRKMRDAGIKTGTDEQLGDWGYESLVRRGDWVRIVHSPKEAQGWTVGGVKGAFELNVMSPTAKANAARFIEKNYEPDEMVMLDLNFPSEHVQPKIMKAGRAVSYLQNTDFEKIERAAREKRINAGWISTPDASGRVTLK